MKKKGIVLCLLCSFIAVCLFGCGKKEGGSAATAGVGSKDYVYRMTDLEVGSEGENINQVMRSGDKIYVYCQYWPDDGGNASIKFYELKEDGSVGGAYDIPLEKDCNINYARMDDEGNIYAVKNEFYPMGAGAENADIQADDADTEGAGNLSENGSARDGAVADSVDGEVGTGPDDADGQDDTVSDDADGEDGAVADDVDGQGDDEADDTDTQDDPDADAVADDVAVDDVVWEEDVEYVDDYYLVKMNLSGEELFSVKLNDVPEFKKLAEDNGYFYIGDMILDKGNGIYINSYGSFFKFDLEGNYVKTVSGSDQSLLDGISIVPLDDGRMVAILNEEDKISFATVDLEEGAIKERYEVPGLTYEYSIYAGTGYDLYLVNSYGVYGYNLGDADKTQLMGYIDSDLDIYNVFWVTGISEEEFFAGHEDMESGYNRLARFTKVPPEDVKEKQPITLAMGYSDWSIRRNVIAFNKANEDYRISILDYYSMYGAGGDYREGLNRLNADIVSGKMPDIVLLDNEMPVDSYISKGLFEDLKPYIEEDGEIDLDDLMPNIIDAYSTNGKMYILVPSYSILTMAAKTSDVGAERGWTLSQVRELLGSKPEGTQLLANMTREEVFDYCMSMSGNQFINWETGECSFDSDSFVEMLEFLKTFPEEIDEGVYTDAYWEEYDSMWRQGKVLASFNYIQDFRGFNNLEKGTFGEDVTMIGFPSANGDGSVITPDKQLAMSARSRSKDGVWEFLRTFLLDEYQSNNIYGFPLSIKRLDELGKEAMEKPYYLEDDGTKVEYDDTFYIGEEEIVIPPMTQQEVDDFKEALYSFKEAHKVDYTLANIIKEEAAPFYAGQKSAKDVAAVIQSRVQIYVNENR